jgi:GH18 family chitinase
MAYDFYGNWSEKTGHHSALFSRKSGDRDFRSQEDAINTWIKLGAEPGKLVLGMATYGRSFKLKDRRTNGMNAEKKNLGKAGPFTKSNGTLAFFEVCQMLKDGWSKKWDDWQKVPYAFKGNQWVGYDVS